MGFGFKELFGKGQGYKEKELDILSLAAMLSKCLWQIEEIDHIINTDYCVDDNSNNKFIDCYIDGNVKCLITSDQHINSQQQI